MIALSRLAAKIGKIVDRGGSVPLVVVRLPDSTHALERETIAAFREAANRIARRGDVLAHERGSDRFVVAMLAPSRAGDEPGAAAVRAALERIAAAMSLTTGRLILGGWCLIASPEEARALERSLDAALERGLRERDRGEMLATVGHELRTPLTSIRGYIETLLDEDLDRATARRFLETARREALRLGRMVEGMLEFSLLDLSADHRDAYCDVVEQIRATIDAALPIGRERRVTIRARLPSQAIARVDGDACTHALLNLVENAIKHGRELGTIEISCWCAEPFVHVLVDDDGPGVEEAERKTVFALGVRGGRTRPPGTGIGLAVVKAIAERAGGSVGIGESPLGGARFALRLPLA